jgi:outer membrane protein assembly factor BamA
MNDIKTIPIKLSVKNINAVLIGILLINLNSFGQVDSTSDTLKLPFPIAKEKRLSDEDLKEKKEGIYLTGEPDLSSDPLTGFGFGAELQLFFDGKKTDPFFAYTPYRAELDLEVFYTSKSERELELICDIPYIFDTKWRFRGHCEYAVDPDYVYFGVTENSLKPLSYYPSNDSSKAIVNNVSYNNYSNNLVGNVADYNTFQQLEKLLSVSMERSWFEGRLRSLIGFEVAGYITTSPLNSNSLLHQQYMEGLITGYGTTTTTLLQFGLMYDTRDNEPDPTSGTFAEFTNEFSATFLGSEYNYNRVFIHYNLYHRLFPDVFKKLVFAARIGAGYTSGNAPFYEYMDDWSSEGDVNGLGGPQTLRGYAQSRFAAPVNAFANLELRYHFLKTDFLEQHLEFAAVPFLDLGGVWNTIDRITNTQNIRYSEGLGLQIAWNEDTILRFDYGISQEGNQFYFGIRKAF